MHSKNSADAQLSELPLKTNSPKYFNTKPLDDLYDLSNDGLKAPGFNKQQGKTPTSHPNMPSLVANDSIVNIHKPMQPSNSQISFDKP
jgi:hypothetical protein